MNTRKWNHIHFWSMTSGHYNNIQNADDGSDTLFWPLFLCLKCKCKSFDHLRKGVCARNIFKFCGFCSQLFAEPLTWMNAISRVSHKSPALNTFQVQMRLWPFWDICFLSEMDWYTYLCDINTWYTIWCNMCG